MITFFIKIHKDLFLWIHNLTTRYPNYNKIISFIADKSDYYVLLFAIIVLTFFVYNLIEHQSWKRLYFLGIEMSKILTSVFLSWLISLFIKNITKLPRPFLRFPGEVTPLFEYGGFNSFPSGHATLFMAFAVMIYFYHKKVGYLFIFFAIIISIARVISGIHFPIDIIIGWIIGGTISYLTFKFLLKKKERSI